MSATEWVFRHAGGCLIEAPDLAEPLPRPQGEPWSWIATVWADLTASDGWGAHEWERAQRGWWLPSTIAIGDVVEFGITWPVGAQTEATVRWYGWLQRCTVHALVLVGPYSHPSHAVAAAKPTIDELRLDQLVDVELLSMVGLDGHS